MAATSIIANIRMVIGREIGLMVQFEILAALWGMKKYFKGIAVSLATC